LYSKPVCFCGYFIPQWVVDHVLKNFQWVWFRRKIPDYGGFYPGISCKMQFRWCIPSYIPLPTLFFCNFLRWWRRRITVTWFSFFYSIFFNFTVTATSLSELLSLSDDTSSSPSLALSSNVLNFLFRLQISLVSNHSYKWAGLRFTCSRSIYN